MGTQAEISNKDLTGIHDEQIPQTKGSPHRNLIIGLWLIAIGMMWILWNARMINWAWTERYGLILLGGIVLTQNLMRRKKRITLGATLVFIGAFHLYLDYSDASTRQLWPVYLLIPGFSLIASYALQTNRWFSLISGIFLAAFGSIFLARELYLIPYGFAAAARTYWPLTLVLGGLIIVCVTLLKNKKRL